MIYIAPCAGIGAAAPAELEEQQPLAGGASCATGCLRLHLRFGFQQGKTQGTADRCKMINVTPCAGVGAVVHEAEAGEPQPLPSGASCAVQPVAPCAGTGTAAHEAEAGEQQQPLPAGASCVVQALVYDCVLGLDSICSNILGLQMQHDLQAWALQRHGFMQVPLVYGCILALVSSTAKGLLTDAMIYVTPRAGVGAAAHEAEVGDQQALAAGGSCVAACLQLHLRSADAT